MKRSRMPPRTITTGLLDPDSLVPGLTTIADPAIRTRRRKRQPDRHILELPGGSVSARLAAAFQEEAEQLERTALVADLFCGAGGTSTGAMLALRKLGVKMKLVAINHNRTAIATHMLNHPKADHYCEDVEAIRPEVVVPGRHLDLLLASPTCTHHSVALGGRPRHDQQRMDPWIVIRWLTSLTVDRLIIENVPEFVNWGPCIDGKPVKERAGEYFKQWIRTIKGLGYRVKWKVFNCADFGDGTTRRRFFLSARCDGKRLLWPTETHAKDPNSGDLFDQGKQPWRVTREFIDWSDLGTSVFTREQDGKPPLRPKTIRRIIAGALKHGWPQVYIDALWALLGEPGPARRQQTGTPGDSTFIAVLRNNSSSQSLGVPLGTVTTSGAHHGLVHASLTPVGAVPITLSQHFGRPFRSVDRPLSTVVGSASIGLLEPIITPYYGSGSGTTGTSVNSPLPACTTKARFAMASPCLVPVTDAGRGEHSPADPFLVPQFGEAPGQAPRTHSLDAPVPAVTSHGAGALVEPVVAPVETSDGTFVDPYGRLVVSSDGQLFMIDVLFRMLRPAELAAAMSFTTEEIKYEFVGTKTEIVRQIGNAVPVRTATALVESIMRW